MTSPPDAPAAPAPPPGPRADASPASPVLNVDARHISPYSMREKVARMLWAMVQATLFRWSFHTWYGWRRFLLTCFKARLHKSVRIRRTVSVECPWNLVMGRDSSLGDGAIAYCLGPVTIGDRVSVSQYAHLCAGTHDWTNPDLPLLRPPITIHNDVWIAADAFVGPNVTVGEGVILGARGCAFKDLEPWSIYGGNPAKKLRARPPFDLKSRAGPKAAPPA